MILNRTQTTKLFAAEFGMTFEEANEILEMVQTFITDILDAGDTVVIRGFCEFGVKTRGVGSRTLWTGEKIDVPDRVHPYFKFARKLKRIVSHEHEDDVDEFMPRGLVRYRKRKQEILAAEEADAEAFDNDEF